MRRIRPAVSLLRRTAARSGDRGRDRPPPLGQTGVRSVVAALAVVVLAGVYACGTGGSNSSSKPGTPPTVTVTPTDRATGVRLDVPVRVTAANGSLSDVRVTSTSGPLNGAYDATHTTWTSTDAVRPGTRYQVSATAAGTPDLVTTAVTAFTTLTPARVLTTDVEPSGGAVVGIGTPIVVNFNHTVTNRAAVQKRLELTMSQPVEGAWNWFSSTQVRYRPRIFWPKGEKVTLGVNLAGFDAGDGLWGTRSRSVDFGVGDAHLSTVDLVAHTLTVMSNGQVLRTFPISGGRPDKPTMGGPHTVLFKAPSMIFDTTGTNAPPSDQYRLTSDWDVNFTSGGEFVHSAPWSVGSQGYTNVSHGCVNAAPDNAAWFYNFSQVGDIINVVNYTRAPELDQDGTDWAWPWEKWVAGDAVLSQHPTTTSVPRVTTGTEGP
jgi:lipoprotein-anchoring transpeptidase ErfK/SrfK